MARTPSVTFGDMQTFEVTARHLSFTLAAHEMNLTQGAVSHRIRRLEMHIGFRLFIRMTRKLALTEEGKRLLATLSHSLRAINDEIEDIRDQDLRGTLHIGIAPTLAHLWLMPRLPRFQTQWPGLNLQFRVRAGVMDFNEERVDLAIYYGATRCRACVAWHSPVASRRKSYASDFRSVRQTRTFELLREKSTIKYFQPFQNRLFFINACKRIHRQSKNFLR